MVSDNISGVNYVWQNWSYWATFIIAFFAALGSVWAGYNIIVMGSRERYRKIIGLMELITSTEERKNRRIIFGYFNTPERSDLEGKELAAYIENIISRANEAESKGRDIAGFASLRNAIEETIILYDQVSFVLLKGGNKLRKDAPQWIYRNIGVMWRYIGPYVELKQEEDKEWAKCYKEIYWTMPERFRVVKKPDDETKK